MTPEPTVERVHVESDGIRGSWIVVVAIGTVIVMACGVAVAWEISRGAGSAEGQAARWGTAPDDVQSIEMSLLPQSGVARAKGRSVASATVGRLPSMFSVQQRADASAESRLSSYGWNERERGTVHIPLARAMELYLKREDGRTNPPASAGARPPKDRR
jgi:hypothetical protein